jgi:hypothetical protein
MTETEEKKEAAGKTLDWAIIPFDEAEDEARWTRLIEETDKLIEEAAELEAVHGELLTENKLSNFEFSEKQTDEELF